MTQVTDSRDSAVSSDLGVKIRLLRVSAGLTQSEFAEKIGVSRTAIANYERGFTPRADVLQKIAALGPVDWLVETDLALTNGLATHAGLELGARGALLPPPVSEPADYELGPGDVLHGAHGRFRIVSIMPSGMYSETYKAVVESAVGTGDFHTDDFVVVKIPRIRGLRGLEDVERYRMAIAKKQTELEAQLASLQDLRKVDSAATVLDHGTHPLIVNVQPAPARLSVFFIVRDFVEDAEPLESYLAARFGDADGAFRGISDARFFFALARRIAESLLEIHRRQVVHGNICPENVMVRPRPHASHDADVPDIVIIDFGQALLLDLVQDRRGHAPSATPYMPPDRVQTSPEHTRRVSADIYGLGGLLFYLATGGHPPASSPSFTDIDHLKTQIESELRARNARLSVANPGIADMIARCLRDCRGEQRRIRNVEDVLKDLEIFEPPADTPHRISEADIRRLEKVTQQLARIHNPFFSWRLTFLLRDLTGVAERMMAGNDESYDLFGDHEDIVTGLTQSLAILREADEYWTVSIPAFWHKRNLGVRGRYLSMNRTAAMRGVMIRRLFLLTDADESEGPRRDIDFNGIAESHCRAIRDLAAQNIQTEDWRPEKGGYYEGFKRIEASQRRYLLSARRHFGLLVKRCGRQEKTILMFPVYDAEDVMVKVQFRVDDGLAETLRRFCLDELADSSPLTAYRPVTQTRRH